MVGHLSSWFNNVRQPLLILTISVVGLLDLFVNAYLNHEDIILLRPSLPAAIRPVDLPIQLALSTASIPDISDIAFSPDTDPSIENVRRGESHVVSLKRSHQAFRNTSTLTPSVIAIQPASTLDCQTVTYPFVGEHVMVRVTDSTGCLTSASLRYRPDQTIAKLLRSK